MVWEHRPESVTGDLEAREARGRRGDRERRARVIVHPEDAVSQADEEVVAEEGQ